MSMESAKAFIERMKTDEDFRKKVTECKDAEARKAFVVSEGYNFSEEDIRNICVELSEEELGSVVGGFGCSLDITDMSSGCFPGLIPI